MNRRTFITTTAAALLSAGCLQSPPENTRTPAGEAGTETTTEPSGTETTTVIRTTATVTAPSTPTEDATTAATGTRTPTAGDASPETDVRTETESSAPAETPTSTEIPSRTPTPSPTETPSSTPTETPTPTETAERPNPITSVYDEEMDAPGAPSGSTTAEGHVELLSHAFYQGRDREEPPEAGFGVEGELRNVRDAPIRRVDVYVEFYDGVGTRVATGRHEGGILDLDAGATAEFDAPALEDDDIADVVAKYVLAIAVTTENVD